MDFGIDLDPKVFNSIKGMELRLSRLPGMVALHLAMFTLDEVKKRAPDIGEGAYPSRLDVWTGLKLEDVNVSAIVFEGDMGEVSGSDLMIRFDGNRGMGSRFIYKHNPWPLDMAPQWGGLRGVAYRTSHALAEEARLRILLALPGLRQDCESLGVKDEMWEERGATVAWDWVREIVALERGVGVVHHPHWRPAVAQARVELDRLRPVMVRYVMSGATSGFLRPESGGVLTMERLEGLGAFQKWIRKEE